MTWLGLNRSWRACMLAATVSDIPEKQVSGARHSIYMQSRGVDELPGSSLWLITRSPFPLVIFPC